MELVHFQLRFQLAVQLNPALSFSVPPLFIIAMMRSLFLNPPISVSTKIRLATTKPSYKFEKCWSKNNVRVSCQKIIENVSTSNGLTSVQTEKSNTVHSIKMLADSESLTLPPNTNSNMGETKEDTKTMNLVPCVESNNTLMEEFPNEIGIVKFLQGKRFLITGATGFLAKVLIEKMLRIVPDVGKIFVLIKAKNKEAAMKRLKNEIINTQLFKCLQQSHGSSYQEFMLSKLVPVVGNVCEPELGMDEDLADEIAKEVDVIINSAANTTFDERYDVALDINTRGPSRLISFVKRCKQLMLFLQVSTAYVNGQRQGKILEKPFGIGDSIAREIMTSDTTMTSPPILDVEAELKLALNTKEVFQDFIMTQKMKELGLERARAYGWQDTYVFTKAMGEMMIENRRGELPIVIIRPSVIESTSREPFPGWMEGNGMMDPIILSYGKGQLTGFLVDPKGVLDVVPAEMVVNATLAAMAKHGVAGKPGMNIYQIASSVVNPLVFQDLARLLFEHFTSNPCIDSRGSPIHVPTMNLFSSMDDFSSHIWTDNIQRRGRVAPTSQDKLSARLENACRKLVKQAKYLANIYEPYTFYGGRFDNTNMKRLMEDMSEEERRCFGFDVGSIDWKDYISNVHIPGLRKHVMKGR